MLDKKMYLSLLGLLCLVATANGQMDSTLLSELDIPDSLKVTPLFDDTLNVALSSTELDLENKSDSLRYREADHREIKVEFSIPDLEDIEMVQLELSTNENTKQVLFRKRLTIDELIAEELIDGSEVTMSPGKYKKNQEYRLCIVLEHKGGKLGQTITKTYEL